MRDVVLEEYQINEWFNRIQNSRQPDKVLEEYQINEWFNN